MAYDPVILTYDRNALRIYEQQSDWSYFCVVADSGVDSIVAVDKLVETVKLSLSEVTMK